MNEADTETVSKKQKQKKKKHYKWKKGDLSKTQEFTDFGDDEVPENNYLNLHKQWTPAEAAELFIFSNDILEMIRTYTVKYANKKLNFTFDVTIDELKVFFSIILLSGYVKCRSRRMYWESAPDTHNEAVSNAMTRNRFDEIMKYIYCYDPDEADEADKCAKVRPLIEKLNELFMKYRPTEKKADVDESMVPYFGSYGASIKQAMRQKPVRFGYKVWCLNYPSGYLLAFDVYQGSKGQNTDYKDVFGVGGGNVLSLIDHFPEHEPLHLFLDNFFTSILLLEEMNKRNIFVTGTFRKDRVGDCPLSSMKSAKRGDHEVYNTVDSDGKPLVFVRWKDNGEITIGSNCIGVDPSGNVRRWSKSERKIVDIPAPGMVLQYNDSMGGTDVIDHAFSCNRPGIRSKKWWFPLLTFCLQSSLHNSYLIYRKTPGAATAYLDFLRPVVQNYLVSYGKSAKVPRGQMLYGNKSVEKRVSKTTRNDQVSHFAENAEKRARCAFCHQPSAVHKCVKCNVHVHLKCFTAFHNSE